MKKIIIAATAIAMFSCNQGNKDEVTIAVDTIATSRPDSGVVVTDAAYFWEYHDDGKGNLALRKTRPISADSMNYQAVLALTNSQYPDIRLEVDKMVNDTLVINIKDSKYLSQQMGSSGPEMYLKELVYNLTELKSIHFVRLNFTEGDHARPGVYSRADFVH